MWKCWYELSEKSYYSDVMIRDSCVTQSGKYDINMTLGIIDTGNKAFIYPIFQIIKQSSILRSSCCMTRVEPRSELLTNVKTNDVCARFIIITLSCTAIISNDLTLLIPCLQYFIGWGCQGKVLKRSVKLQHIKQVEVCRAVQQGTAWFSTTSFKEIWSELGMMIMGSPWHHSCSSPGWSPPPHPAARRTSWRPRWTGWTPCRTGQPRCWSSRPGAGVRPGLRPPWQWPRGSLSCGPPGSQHWRVPGPLAVKIEWVQPGQTVRACPDTTLMSNSNPQPDPTCCCFRQGKIDWSWSRSIGKSFGLLALLNACRHIVRLVD